MSGNGETARAAGPGKRLTLEAAAETIFESDYTVRRLTGACLKKANRYVAGLVRVRKRAVFFKRFGPVIRQSKRPMRFRQVRKKLRSYCKSLSVEPTPIPPFPRTTPTPNSTPIVDSESTPTPTATQNSNPTPTTTPTVSPTPTATSTQAATPTPTATATVTPTATATPSPTPTSQGAPVRPIARWDVVPHQRIQAGESLKIGVVAFSKAGIDRVEFQVSGGGYVGPNPLVVSEIAFNERTQVDEYWVELSANDFTIDGPIEVRATVIGNDGGVRDETFHTEGTIGAAHSVSCGTDRLCTLSVPGGLPQSALYNQVIWYTPGSNWWTGGRALVRAETASSVTFESPQGADLPAHGDNFIIGEAYGLEPLVLVVNPNNGLPKPVAYVDPNKAPERMWDHCGEDTGTIDDPNDPFATVGGATYAIQRWMESNGYGSHVDGGVIRLNPGVHYQSHARCWSRANSVDEWLTITSNPNLGGNRYNTHLKPANSRRLITPDSGTQELTGGGYLFVPHVHIEDLTLSSVRYEFEVTKDADGNVTNRTVNKRWGKVLYGANATRYLIKYWIDDSILYSEPIEPLAPADSDYPTLHFPYDAGDPRNILLAEFDPTLFTLPEEPDLHYKEYSTPVEGQPNTRPKVLWYTESSLSRMGKAVAAAALGRNIEISDLGDDAFVQSPFVVNARTDKLDPRNGECECRKDGTLSMRHCAHADCWQWWGDPVPHNAIIYNYSCVRAVYQGLFVRTEDGGNWAQGPNPITEGVAIINMHTNMTDFSNGGNSWYVPTNHFLLWNSSFNKRLSFYDDAEDNGPETFLSIENFDVRGNALKGVELNANALSNDWVDEDTEYSSCAPGVNLSGWDRNHFEEEQTHSACAYSRAPGRNVSLGDPEVNLCWMPISGSRLLGELVPPLVPVDVNGTRRVAQSALGAFEHYLDPSPYCPENPTDLPGIEDYGGYQNYFASLDQCSY